MTLEHAPYHYKIRSTLRYLLHKGHQIQQRKYKSIQSMKVRNVLVAIFHQTLSPVNLLTGCNAMDASNGFISPVQVSQHEKLGRSTNSIALLANQSMAKRPL